MNEPLARTGEKRVLIPGNKKGEAKLPLKVLFLRSLSGCRWFELFVNRRSDGCQIRQIEAKVILIAGKRGERLQRCLCRTV